ncbi:MAG: hypothetical protein GY796_17610 [Chloroflexi bacterium]|nr:hypothetical protein [Chloroflexota bacterium]
MIGYVVEGRQRPLPISYNYCAGYGETAVANVILPKPVGAETRVSLQPCCSPWLSCLMRWGQGMGNGRNLGTYSFVCSKSPDMGTLYWKGGGWVESWGNGRFPLQSPLQSPITNSRNILFIQLLMDSRTHRESDDTPMPSGLCFVHLIFSNGI